MTENNTFNKILRSYCVSVRLNNEELSLLNERRGSHRKGEWLRMAFLHNLPSVIPSINLEAWKTLGEISQKLNRLVAHLDSKSNDSSLSQTELFAVKRQISELRTNLITDNMWSASHEGNAKNPQG
ncbi:ATP-binding protein [Pectobacterium carotovorum subsp. carotovorum]|nr:ATP-binding protein [Pectobacterium carotovorum subsp. carotovorum]GLX45926.1 ATP-binding protein [Pectobacterium carotovorum subsp. carotovorum]